MSKSRTILGHEVIFERRRYGTTTYTWAEVKIKGEYHSLGDPWQKITPSRAELEEAARPAIALVTSCYFDLVNACKPLIESYENDLLVHDREIILMSPGVPYLHWTRSCGTHIQLLHPADSECYPAKGDKIPYLFGEADREHVLQGKESMAKWALDPMKSETLATHHFDGNKLRKITAADAKAIMDDYVHRIRLEWEGKRRLATAG